MQFVKIILLLQTVYLFMGCTHSSKRLMKRMNCEQIQKIKLNIKYNVNEGSQNLPLQFKAYQGRVYFDIELRTSELNKFKTKCCLLIDSLKHLKLNKYEERLLKKQISLKKDTLYLSGFSLDFYRKKDWLTIIYDPLFYRNSPFFFDKSSGSDGLFHLSYASSCYFNNIAMTKNIISLVNEIILHKNEQIRKDTTIVDNLKVMYPLVNYPIVLGVSE
jgi:hypothetical protein